MSRYILLLIFVALAYSSYAQKGFIPVDNDDDIYFQFDSSDAIDRVTEPDRTPVPRYDLSDYFFRTLVFPKDTGARDALGAVTIRFLVEKNGEIGSVSIIEGVTESVDKEAMRAIYWMPRWKPATLDGKRIKMRCTLRMKYPWSYLYENAQRPFIIRDGNDLRVLERR